MVGFSGNGLIQLVMVKATASVHALPLHPTNQNVVLFDLESQLRKCQVKTGKVTINYVNV